CLLIREAHKGPVQLCERSDLPFLEQLCESTLVTLRGLRLYHLCDSLIEPDWTLATCCLVYKGMGQFVLQHAAEFGSDTFHSLDRHAQLAVIKRGGPGWSVGDIKECLVGIEDYCDGISWKNADFAHQIVVVMLKRVQELTPKSIG